MSCRHAIGRGCWAWALGEERARGTRSLCDETRPSLVARKGAFIRSPRKAGTGRREGEKRGAGTGREERRGRGRGGAAVMRADGWCRVGRWASPDGCGAGGSVGSLSSRASSEHAPLCRMVWVWAAAIGGGWGRWEMQSEMGQPVNTSAAGWEVPQMRQRARSALDGSRTKYRYRSPTATLESSPAAVRVLSGWCRGAGCADSVLASPFPDSPLLSF